MLGHMSLLNIIERGKAKVFRTYFDNCQQLVKFDHAGKGGREKKEVNTKKEMLDDIMEKPGLKIEKKICNK